MPLPSYARMLLEQRRFVVEDVPTSDKQESDFLVKVNQYTLLIEEKTKLDDPAYLAARARSLDLGEIHGSGLRLTPDNRLSAIVAKAAAQLESSSDRSHDFRLVWFTATGAHAEAKYWQFIATLYGTTKIYERGSAHYRTCYFFRNSDFYRHRQVLDGAVVASLDGNLLTVRLCINLLSPKYQALVASRIASTLGIGVEDPGAKELQGAFVLDADIDRADESALLAYLEAKYQTGPLMRFDTGYISAAIQVPNVQE